MKDIKKPLGNRIKELRKQQNMSQQNLAETAGIEQRSLSKIECGYNFPSKTIGQIANGLKVSLPDLFDFEHHNLTEEEMKKHIIDNLDYLTSSDIKTLYRLIKAMR